MNLGYKCIKSYYSQMRLIGAKTYVLIPLPSPLFCLTGSCYLSSSMDLLPGGDCRHTAQPMRAEDESCGPISCMEGGGTHLRNSRKGGKTTEVMRPSAVPSTTHAHAHTRTHTHAHVHTHSLPKSLIFYSNADLNVF